MNEKRITQQEPSSPLPPEAPVNDKAQAPPGKSSGRGRCLAFKLAALALTIVSALAGTGLARWLRAPGDGVPEASTPARPAVHQPFQGWKKPDFVVVITAQMNGYVLPCGCSRPQIGGLERRYNFLKQIKDRGWHYVAVDLGDLIQRHAPANLPNQQALIKYNFTMRALKEMDYAAVSFGEAEANQGLLNVLADWALQEPKPRVVVSNLIDADKNFPEMTVPWKLVTVPGKGINVGVTGVIGPMVAERMKELSRNDNTVRFERTPDALNRTINDMSANKVHFPVLLFQGAVSRMKPGQAAQSEPVRCAEAYPQFPLIVCLTDKEDPDEPAAKPLEVTTKTGTRSLVVSLGRKGKYVGVLGVFLTGDAAKPFEYRYEQVELGEQLMTPEGKEKGHPIVELMEAYTTELKSQNYLEKYGQVRHGLQVLPPVADLNKNVPVTFAGSDACKKCHRKAHKIWENTPHSHAYQTLVDAKRPAKRQHDPECIVCHTVGFGYQSGFVSEAKTPNLKDVGCESCHGPSSVHVANPNDAEWQKRINPWKYLPGNKRKEAIDAFCQKCHDTDNDVHWIHGAFEKTKWPRVKHYEGPDPMLENPQAAGMNP